MSTPEFEIHRAIVHSSNVTTGAAEVRIPSLLGAGQTVNIPTTGLTLSAGEWNVPSAGSSAFVAVSADRTQFLWLTGVTVPTDSDIDFTDNVTIGGDLTVDGEIDATHINSEFDGPVVLSIKNTSGSTIAKGSPVYATGSVGQSGAVEVSPSRADTSGTMPALGLTQVELAHNGEGHAVVLGVIDQVDTSAYTINDSLYVAPTGGLTNIRPTGSDELVQKIGRVVRVNQSTGEILVLGAGRTNDVPNVVVAGGLTIDTDTLHVDSTNDRVGIGTTSPVAPLHLYHPTVNFPLVVESGDTTAGIAFADSGSTGGYYNQTIGVNGNDIRINAGGTARLTVASSGNVGINDSTPSYRLDVNGTGRFTGDLIAGTITSGSITSSGTVTSGNIRLSAQPLTTYGSGVSANPSYYIEQVMGSNDHWRIYGEGGSNDGRMVLHVGDDQAERIVFRFKKTYSPYTATDHYMLTDGIHLSGNVYANYAYFNNVIETNEIAGDNGSASDVTFMFKSDTDTGMYRYASGEAALSGNGSWRGRTTSYGMTANYIFNSSGNTYNDSVCGGAANRIAFRWASPYMKGSIDNVICANVANFSDARLKTNIRDWDNGIDILRQMRTVEYTPRDIMGFGEITGNLIEGLEPKDDIIGLIAQEVREILPSAISGDPDGTEMLSIAEDQIMAVVISALQNIDTRLQALETA